MLAGTSDVLSSSYVGRGRRTPDPGDRLRTSQQCKPPKIVRCAEDPGNGTVGLLIVTWVAALLFGCDEPESLLPLNTLHDEFLIVDSVSITPSVPTTLGQTHLASFMDGSLLITDPQARAVHIIGEAGQRQRSFPSGGTDQPRLVNPTSARPTPDGDLLVSDSGRVILYHLDGGTDIPAEVLPASLSVFDAWALGDDRYVLRGLQEGADRRHVLHLWNTASREDHAFFPWPAFEDLAVFIGGLDLFDAALRQDTLWAVYAFSDTVYAFDVGDDEPSRVHRVPIPLAWPLGVPDHAHGSQATGRDTDLVQLTDLFLLEDGEFAVQSVRRSRDTGLLRWGLTIFDSDGKGLFQHFAGPRLLLVSGSDFYFADEAADQSLRLIVARRR